MLRITGICGILSGIITISFIFLAISYSPNFNIVDNWLSELGSTESSIFVPVDERVGTTTTVMLFNTGLILGGALACMFGFGLIVAYREKLKLLGSIGMVIYIVAGAALCAVAIFPWPTGAPHYIAAFAFYILMPAAILFVAVSVIRAAQTAFGVFSIIMGIMATITGIVLIAAVQQITSALFIFAWTIVFGVKLIVRI